MTNEEVTDGDGYPTEATLKRIREWDAMDFAGLMAFVRSVWWSPDWGWDEKDGLFSISTGGWSGNEELIGAMQENRFFWMLCWESSRRGGHYEFAAHNSWLARRRKRDDLESQVEALTKALEVRLSTGRFWLSVAGHAVAMEGDPDRNSGGQWTREKLERVVADFAALKPSAAKEEPTCPRCRALKRQCRNCELPRAADSEPCSPDAAKVDGWCSEHKRWVTDCNRISAAKETT